MGDDRYRRYRCFAPCPRLTGRKRAITTAAQGEKSIYYLGRLTEGSEPIALGIAICLCSQYFAWFAWVFGALCWLTTTVRITMAIDTFRR